MQRKRAGIIAIALSLLPIASGVRHYLSVQPFLQAAIATTLLLGLALVYSPGNKRKNAGALS